MKKKIMAAILTGVMLLSGYSPLAPVQATAEAATYSKPYFLMVGERYLGTPYQYGATRLFNWNLTFNRYFTGKTFDCSSFTQFIAWKGFGIKLQGDSRAQAAKNGYYIPKSHLRSGDLVFFTNSSRAYLPVGNINRVGHVGFFAGYGSIVYGIFRPGAYGRPVMLHASPSGGVKYSYIDTPYYKRNYIASKRVVWW